MSKAVMSEGKLKAGSSKCFEACKHRDHSPASVTRALRDKHCSCSSQSLLCSGITTEEGLSTCSWASQQTPEARAHVVWRKGN